jgi:hypothetical protein
MAAQAQVGHTWRHEQQPTRPHCSSTASCCASIYCMAHALTRCPAAAAARPTLHTQ